MTGPVHGFLISLRGVYETLAISAPTVIDATLSRMTRERADERLTRWSRRLLDQADVELTVSGREHLSAGTPYVVMSNHQSHYDIPIMFQVWPGTMRMVTKTELFRMPIWGRAMTASGFVEIDRSNRERAIESLHAARERLASGISVWIAPEGTRSRTGELYAFKKGGFHLAMETGLPVVPVSIVGSRNILSAHAVSVHKGAKVHVVVGQPIAPGSTDPTPEALDALMAQVRGAIEAGMEMGRLRLAR